MPANAISAKVAVASRRYESGVSVAASWYIWSRQVQNEPRPAWVRLRSARWKACEWALTSPGMVSPGSRSASRWWRLDSDGHR